jgi:hypothetical protein
VTNRIRQIKMQSIRHYNMFLIKISEDRRAKKGNSVLTKYPQTIEFNSKCDNDHERCHIWILRITLNDGYDEIAHHKFKKKKSRIL